MKTASTLRPVSINFLYPGMHVKENIFDFSATGLLVPAGRILSSQMIEKIINVNKGQESIYVSESTYEDLRGNSQEADDSVTVNKKLENETGYTGIVNDSTDLIKKIAARTDLPKEAVYSVTGQLAHRLKITKPDVVVDIVNAIAPADEYLRRHIVNVSMLNGLIGRWMGLSENEINVLIMVGLVHDCGKAVIPSEILDAPRRLSLVEFEVMKTHPAYGYVLLKGLPELIRDGALHHHEKVNGGGYPDKLQLDDISFLSRVTSVSDVYDALVSRRVYKEPLSPFSVLSMLSEMRGKDLDAHVADVFIEKMPGELIGKRVRLSDGRTGEIKAADFSDLEFPYVSLGGNTVKTSKDLYCLSML